jgi:hypothetical protein
MTHIAMQEHLDGKTVEWMEKVSDTQYGTPVDARGSGSYAGWPNAITAISVAKEVLQTE